MKHKQIQNKQQTQFVTNDGDLVVKEEGNIFAEVVAEEEGIYGEQHEEKSPDVENIYTLVVAEEEGLDVEQVKEKYDNKNLEDTFQTPGALMAAEPRGTLLGRVDSTQAAYFIIGALAATALATILVSCIFLCRRSRNHGKRCRRSTLSTWGDEIKFQDECDSTTDEEEYGSLEDDYNMHYLDSHPRGPIDAFCDQSYDSRDIENDWLGGVGYDNKDNMKSETTERSKNYTDNDDNSDMSDYGEDKYRYSLEKILNNAGDSISTKDRPRSNCSGSESLDNPPRSPTLLLSSEPLVTPSVSELFKSTLSKHKTLEPPIDEDGSNSSS